MRSHVPVQCFSAIGGEGETGDLYCSHCWAGQATPYWPGLSKTTAYQDGTPGSLPATCSHRVQLNICNLSFKFSHGTYWQISSQVAARGILVAAGHEAWALRPPCYAHTASSTLGCWSWHRPPTLIARDPLTELGLSGKASAGAGAATGEAQLANWLPHGLQHHKPLHLKGTQPKRSFYYSEVLLIYYLDGKRQKEKKRQFQSKKSVH